MASGFVKYGITVDAASKTDADLMLELEAIRKGGSWTDKDGTKQGLGLFEHFMNARKILWPNRWRHKWVDLVYREILENMVTILMGSMSSGKTSIGSEFCLLDYWAHPDNTLVLMSTTSVDKLKSGVFAEVSMLWSEGKKKFSWLAGNLLDHKTAITTDKLKIDPNDQTEEITIRDMRKGIVGKACFSGSQFVGLGVYQGIKQERIRFLADELQFMAPTFFDCLPNMIGSVNLDANDQPQIKIIGSGNPKHDPFDQLGVAAEPDNGWESVGFVEKTTCWNTKFHRGRCVNLIGTDSPNFDVPAEAKIPYPRLVNRMTIASVEKRWDRSSLKFNEQCVGRMMLGFTGSRVITRDLCKNNGASLRAFWRDDIRIRIGGVDPAWSANGDRCIWAWLEFGESIDGKQIMRYGGHNIIPLVGGTNNEPDDQIAAFVKKQSALLKIPSINIFYGSTGRGTTGAAFAKVYGDAPPVPIAEGSMPSQRPVRHDLFIEENGVKRHKRCDEEYSKFITELWFSVRNIIECGQMRELPEDVINEGCARQYTTVKGSKIEVESKEEMKETLGYSPDLFDTLTFLCEGARQRGFKIKRLGEDIIDLQKTDDWLGRQEDRYNDAIKSSRMSYA